ncbi:MAG: ATPase, T2SS/T4P/T4SS family [Planctomycetota bacterium]|nr:ATPase, T2SS/T4P/T4SS family [Planctomycetota bacterium]
MAERLYSPQQVAELLGVTPETIHGWVRRGWLGAERLLEGRLVIGESAVAQFLKNQGIDIEELFVKTVMREGAGRPAAGTAAESRAAGASPPPAPPPAEQPQTAPAATSAAAASDLPAGAVGQVLDAVLKDAVNRGATAIHLDAEGDGLALRLRVGGRLYEKTQFKPRLPRGMRTSLPALCKRMAGLRPEEAARPQRGGFRVRIDGQDRHFRIQSCPTSTGESIVITLDGRQAAPAIEGFGFSEEDLVLVRRMLAEPAGLVLVASPPRSVGPRFLAALAAVLGAGERRIAVIARRTDFEVPGAFYVRPDAEAMPTAAAIRAVAEQDTDVIVLEDLCDSAAVAAALDAAGERLVLAGLAIRGDGGGPSPLADAGADPLALAQSLVGTISVASLRQICDSCRTTVATDLELQMRLGLGGEADVVLSWRGSGCAACGQTGYAGETTATAVLAVGEEMARLIRRSAGRQAIEDAARRAGARTLRDAVMEKVLEGETSLEEAARALHV